MPASIQNPIFTTQGDNPSTVAAAFKAFVDEAKKKLHIAIYDFELTDPSRKTVVDAILAAAKRKVEVQIAFDHTRSNQKQDNKGGVGNDPAPRGTSVFVPTNFPKDSGVENKPIEGSHLMHNKYIIRDDGDVWMGSANFTDGAWGLQENNILRIHSPDLAARYEEDFQDLWTSGNILKTGINDYASFPLDGKSAEVSFAPGMGSACASLFGDAIQGAGHTIWIATMVLSSGSILGDLCDYMDGGGLLVGIYDATQMRHIESMWHNSPKAAQWDRVKSHLVGKNSTPYSSSGPHDFMHNKFLVTDTTVVTGSFNLSKNAESNAENVLSLPFPDLAEQYKAYVETLVKKYSKK